tara:strand:- start:212 stop:325 length:114 start_codon:yes stop_codon:yes gene_type:complete
MAPAITDSKNDTKMPMIVMTIKISMGDLPRWLPCTSA